MKTEHKQEMHSLRREIKIIDAQISELQSQRRDLKNQLWPLEREYTNEQSRQRASARQTAEKRSFDKFHSIQPGDVVRVRGTKDSRNPFRRVIRVDSGTFHGEKLIKQRDGRFRDTGVFSTNGIEKIAEQMIEKE